MAKKAGLPIDVTGEGADKVMWRVLYFLRNKFQESNTLINKYVEPVVTTRGCSRPVEARSRIDAIHDWFLKLDEGRKRLVLHEVVKNLMNQSDTVKKITTSALKLHYLQFAQGSFWDTKIKSTEFRTVFHSYVRDKKLGEGGNGTVWKMRRDDDFVCAMKLLSIVNSQTTRRDRFLNELWFCALADHPNIVKVLDWGLSVTGGDAFYVMPLYDGNLRDLIETGIEPDNVPTLVPNRS
jgi:hypothetical protein